MNLMTSAILMIVFPEIIQKILKSTYQEIDVSDKQIFLTLFCVVVVYQLVSGYTYNSHRWADHLAPNQIGFMTI